MLKKVKHIIRRMVLREKCDSETFVSYLKRNGVDIADTAWIVAPTKVTIDMTRPYLISIGAFTTITEGVMILTHGFDWSVIKRGKGLVLGSAGSVSIGDNVFIGVNSTILKGVTIGDNVIVAAGSLVTRDIPSNTVAMGRPCKPYMSLDEYMNRRIAKQLDEASDVIASYYRRYGKYPPEEELAEFCMLFASRETIISNNAFRAKAQYGLDEGDLWQPEAYVPRFGSYEHLANYVGERYGLHR